MEVNQIIKYNDNFSFRLRDAADTEGGIKLTSTSISVVGIGQLHIGRLL